MSASKIFIANSVELRRGDFSKVLSDIKKVDMFLTSPPYNIGSKGKRQDGMRKIGKYDRKSFGGIQSYSDSLPEEEYQLSQQEFLRWCLERLKPNGVIAYVHKNRHKNLELLTPYSWILPMVASGELKIYEEITWDRGSTHNHDKNYLYPQSERIFILIKPGGKPKFKNYDPSNRVKGMGDVWKIGRAPNSIRHDAAFPEELVERLLRCYTKAGNLIVDPYSGSGTTMLVANRLKRKFIGSELSASHFKTAVVRFKKAEQDSRIKQKKESTKTKN